MQVFRKIDQAAVQMEIVEIGIGQEIVGAVLKTGETEV